jgi:hypothetical protein
LYTITDNSAAELGKSIEISDVLEAARKVDANEVWAADKLFDKNATLKLTTKFIESMSDSDLRNMVVVGLPQGKNMSEWVSCYKTMLEMPEIKVIGLSKYSICAFRALTGTSNLSVCRRAALDYLYNYNLVSDKPFHLAGADNLIVSELAYARKYPSVRSIDSNICFKLGVLGHKIDEAVYEPVERLDHEIQNLTSEQKKLITYNINLVNRFTGI